MYCHKPCSHRQDSEISLSDLIEMGLLRPGVGVLTCSWWGVRLEPAATLTPQARGRIAAQTIPIPAPSIPPPPCFRYAVRWESWPLDRPGSG